MLKVNNRQVNNSTTKTSYRTDRYNFQIHQALPIPTLKDNVILGTTYPTSHTSRKKSN